MLMFTQLEELGTVFYLQRLLHCFKEVYYIEENKGK